MELRNYTGRLERGEAFVRAKMALADTEALSIHVKFTKARGRDVSGYYRWKDRRMVLAVKQRLRYPRAAAYGVGTTPRDTRRSGGAPYRLVWHEEQFASADDLLVFVAGHEFWHYLCHSGQRKRDHETKANCNGFAWLREFREWTGPQCAVQAIPAVPPRPDRTGDTAGSPSPLPPSFDARPLFPAIAAPRSTTVDALPLFPAIAALPAAATRPSRITAARAGIREVLQSAKQLLLFR